MKDSNLKYIFVHGLSGWGSYDENYKRMPYWGMRNGDLITQLRKAGYDAYSASVSPHGSAYDRACELYAQLSGARTDYGKRHAEKYGHERFGPDFTGRALIDGLKEGEKLVLLGHSFGGATIRVFADIMDSGRETEMDEDCSDFFKGGKAGLIFALIALATPHNGTTAYDMYEDPNFDPETIKGNPIEQFGSVMMSRANTGKSNLIYEDSAAFDMHIDNALKLNESLKLNENIYYFSQPCEITVRQKDGTYTPIMKETEPMISRSAKRMGAYTGKTRGGFILSEDWRPNDGLVNTISAKYPLSDRSKPFDESNVEKGLWNVFETFHGDHMSLQGGMFRKKVIYPYYERLLSLIDSLQDKQ
jgi:triacylglycerol esterase/lipase EstA (alpha/beta hydrolase family)